ncbi:uracil-DNA glycosylase [Thermosulfuriphilus ammonigenes]|uniref:Uracil-DNA glycosylase n=2 Tax=Thermosulfuriphilus ammonigenes TaxID=1936021 RepID=A0A6G7PXW4_9BACT|nr:uracil-DNA glycosylase [Thermosulfuriphilus ammonigenes]QIJ72535.1 uracil-DNA glycosylase [Thermosulfuriphilus ammonigenes]
MRERKRSPESTAGRCICCRHYYLTWDRRFPHGCKAFGFKSAGPPSRLVLQSSGALCRLFVAKEAKKQSE